MTAPDSYTLRLGTRGSKLAMAQSQQIADALMRHHAGLRVELVICKTTGDRVTDRLLQDIGGKGLFVKEIEEALLRKEIDFAVHSFKDLPVTEPLVDESDLVIAAVPRRADVRDVLVSHKSTDLMSLPSGARVGTGSLRRRCQILAARRDLQIVPIRGNVDTRIGKVTSGELDAVILAAAGLDRCGLRHAGRDHAIETALILPAAAQGALALQCGREDSETIDLLKALNHSPTRICTDLERAVVALLDGDCHSPIAALAEMEGNSIRLRARVGRRDGELPVIAAEAVAPLGSENQLLETVISLLKEQDAIELLG